MAEQKNQQLKMIENHIKDLLFNKNSQAESLPTSSNQDLNCNMSPYMFNEKTFLTNSETAHHKEKLLSSMPLDYSINKQPSNSSQLIDLNVLTNFAAKHADINDISNASRVLPHPDMEDDSLTSPGANITKDIFLNYSISQENKTPGIFPGFGEDLKNSDKNCIRPDHSNDSERGMSDRRKKKRSRKQNTKDKPNRKVQGNLERPINQSVSPIKDSSFKQENVSVNKHYSSQKEAHESPEKKKEFAHIQSDHSRISIPVGEEYTVNYTKEGYKFLCVICNYEAKSRDYIHKHVNSENHKEQRKQIQSDKVLPFLPKPLPAQTEAINELLMKCHADHGLQEEHLLLRQKVAEKLVEFAKLHLTDCTVEAIGSSVTGLGLKTSKLDLSLKVLEVENIPDSLELLHEKLRTDPTYCNVVSVFKQKRLGILFTEKETKLDCSIVLENSVSDKFARLFSLYSELDPRVKILASCFRYWAQICGLDNQDRGTLPSYAFSLLLVYFLQQTEPPVLPVLHEVKEYGTADFQEKYVKGGVWKSENNCSVGELWIQLFYFYNFYYEMGKHVVCIRSSDKVMCSEKNWSTKFYAIEDPFTRRNIAHVIPNFQVCQYIQQCFIKTYRYFAFPQTINGEIKLLKSEEYEDLLQSYSLAKSEAEYDYTSDGADESGASDNEDSSIPDESSFLQDFEDQDPDIPIESVISTVKQMNLDEDKAVLEDGEVLEDSPDQANTSSQQGSVKLDSPKKEPKKNKDKIIKEDDRAKVRDACSWDVRDHHFSVDAFNYKMDPSLLKSKKEVPLCCKNCKSTGHLKKNCPNDRLPPPSKLPPVTEEYLRVVTKTLHYIKERNCVDDDDKGFMTQVMREIESHIQKLFPEASLCMFGSFCNGFGFKSRSDMDFCLTFKNQDDRKDLDCTEVIEKLAKHLRDFPKLGDIVPVTSAKVPIVKFVCKETGLEGDISLYNTLALVNTEMLELYSRIDPRVQMLGFALKYFAKVLGICDASRGSLSSYAYILMAIFFLQQRQPPVIPVLQELHDEDKPSSLVDGWNVWYFKDLDKLPEIWPDYSKNTETAAELWLGLLSFYAYDFDWQEYVVCIRQKAPLTKFKKLWITEQIAIEDPFDLNHNLGAGLSQKMNMYILRTFVRGRERFGETLINSEIHNLHGHEVAYFFDRHFLNSGAEPPHDRGCRKCGKIGHIAKNCTQEKLCTYCKKPGHLIKSCPKKKQQMKSKHNERNSQEHYSMYEGKHNMEVQNVQGHSLRPHGGEIQRTNNLPHNLPKNSEEFSRKLLQMGYPTHRHPPPGFPKSFMGPPPGFKTMHQNSTKFHRFPSPCPAPFPRTMPVNNVSQSPPKHFSCSPPKNYMGGKMYHPDPVPSMGIRSELHMSPSDSMLHRMWQNQMPNRMSQQYTDRRKRTN